MIKSEEILTISENSMLEMIIRDPLFRLQELKTISVMHSKIKVEYINKDQPLIDSIQPNYIKKVISLKYNNKLLLSMLSMLNQTKIYIELNLMTIFMKIQKPITIVKVIIRQDHIMAINKVVQMIEEIIDMEIIVQVKENDFYIWLFLYNIE